MDGSQGGCLYFREWTGNKRFSITKTRLSKKFCPIVYGGHIVLKRAVQKQDVQRDRLDRWD